MSYAKSAEPTPNDSKIHGVMNTVEKSDTVKPASARRCGLCRQLGHLSCTCPHTDCAKPSTPDSDLVVEEECPLGVFDVENSGDRINEVGAVVATYMDGKWNFAEKEFHFVTGEPVIGWARTGCPNLVTEAAVREEYTFAQCFNAFIGYIQEYGIVYLKAHNGVATDLQKVIEAAKVAGILDPIGELEAAGVLGIIDPARFIPQHKITALQIPKAGINGGPPTHSGYLKNEELYKMATGKTMQENGLCPHRALNDAKAEREWLKLPAVTNALFGSTPRLQCAVSLVSFRAYSEQYKKHYMFIQNHPNLSNTKD